MTPLLDGALADMAAARAAGELTPRHFRRFHEIKVGVEGPADFVSDADREAELLIRDRLLGRYPRWSLAGEELPPEEREGGHRFVSTDRRRPPSPSRGAACARRPRRWATG